MDFFSTSKHGERQRFTLSDECLKSLNSPATIESIAAIKFNETSTPSKREQSSWKCNAIELEKQFSHPALINLKFKN